MTRRFLLACLLMLMVPLGGVRLCENTSTTVQSGANYCPPTATVAQEWIDSADQRVRTDCDDLSRWWTVFNDPGLDTLICCAYHQNLTLRQAGVECWSSAQLGSPRGTYSLNADHEGRLQP